MKKYVSYNKLSKREKRKRDNERRVTWEMNPVTRKKENKRIYNRKKSREFKDDVSYTGIFYFMIYRYITQISCI